jgi:hypothetical protein
MLAMDRWDIFLIVGAAYFAIASLVRLMTARRDAVVKHLRAQIEAHRAAREASEEDRDIA